MKVLWVMNVISRSFIWLSGVSKGIFVFFLFRIVLTADYRAAPIASNTTYVPAWNVPSDECARLYNISVDLSLYSLIGNPKANAIRQNVTLFYVSKLGLYPHIDPGTKKEKHGTIPQSGNINAHLQKAEQDIVRYLPKDELGLAVIDWEDWRPLWVRNWADKDIYRKKSIDLVKNRNTNLTQKEVVALAEKEFEEAGKEFMLKTLQLGVRLRPKNYWGFYLFPDCYNHNYRNNSNYTGSCPDVDKKRNNQLDWLWKESTALYPSIYLNTKLKRTPIAALFSRNRIYEAIRLAKVRDPNNPLPVFVYVRPVFTDNITEFLSEIDLVNTIGESYALGASGIIVWGSFTLTQSKDACRDLVTFERTTLNRYLINVTLAAKMCHQVLCQDQGFCTRKNWNSNDYLHLNPRNFFIEFAYCDKFIIHGEPSIQDLKQFSDKFDCSCFTNETCKKNDNIENIKNIRVCINEEVCLSAYVNPESDGFPSINDETLTTPITETAKPIY